MARIFKALGDPTRLAIFELIRDIDPGEGHTAAEIDTSLSQIAGRFALSLSTVSHHVKELRGAGLVRCERRGQTIRCTVDEGALSEIGAFLARR